MAHLGRAELLELEFRVVGHDVEALREPILQRDGGGRQVEQIVRFRMHWSISRACSPTPVSGPAGGGGGVPEKVDRDGGASCLSTESAGRAAGRAGGAAREIPC